MQIISNKEQQVCPIIFPAPYGSVGTYNFFIMKQNNSLTLIDAGINHDSCWEHLNLTLAELEANVSDIECILLTHHHEDHVGLLKRILAVKDIPIYAHPIAIQRLQMDSSFFHMRYQFFDNLYKEMDCHSDARPRLEKMKKTLNELNERKLTAEFIPIQQGDIVCGFEVIETPGHSPDSISFLDRKRKWAFTGDLILKDFPTNAIIDPDQNGIRLKSVSQQRESLVKCAEMDVQFVFPGHKTIIEEHKQLVNQKLASMNRKSQRLLALITECSQTASSLAKRYYKSKYKTEFSLVMSEIIGHLDYLEEQNSVGKEKIDGKWIYSIK
ncbi:MBL fold metallo-hydrolase [Rummeliibacillus sp. JY-2-4R]